MCVSKATRERIVAEKALFERRRGGDIRLCVVYPLGMANLRFQAVFHIFESDLDGLFPLVQERRNRFGGQAGEESDDGLQKSWRLFGHFGVAPKENTP
jgi:hypothetical protein